MLKISVNKTNECQIEIHGELKENVAELLLGVANIYGLLRQRNEELAALFKMCVQAGVLDGSPVWDGEVTPGGVGIVLASEKRPDGAAGQSEAEA